MMEVTNVNILRRKKSKSPTINLHTVLSTVMMDNPAVFTDLTRSTFGVTAQKSVDVITNIVEYFGDLLSVNDGDIDNFVKDTHYSNNSRVSAQRILISKNVTKGLKSMLFEKNDR